MTFEPLITRQRSEARPSSQICLRDTHKEIGQNGRRRPGGMPQRPCRWKEGLQKRREELGHLSKEGGHKQPLHTCNETKRHLDLKDDRPVRDRPAKIQRNTFSSVSVARKLPRALDRTPCLDGTSYMREA